MAQQILFDLLPVAFGALAYVLYRRLAPAEADDDRGHGPGPKSVEAPEEQQLSPLPAAGEPEPGCDADLPSESEPEPSPEPGSEPEGDAFALQRRRGKQTPRVGAGALGKGAKAHGSIAATGKESKHSSLGVVGVAAGGLALLAMVAVAAALWGQGGVGEQPARGSLGGSSGPGVAPAPPPAAPAPAEAEAEVENASTPASGVADADAPTAAVWPDLVLEATMTEKPAVLLDASVAEAEEESEITGEEKLITLNLTRQQMAINSVGGVLYYKSAYWGTLTVGTPPVAFKMVFDTGSGHLILPSTYCHSETCRSHKRYRRSTSTTAMDIDYDGTIVKPGEPRDQITVSFGTGEVAGVFIEDVVCVEDGVIPERARLAQAEAEGNPDGPSLPEGCVKLRMIAATDMSEEPFKDFQFDGVLGLGLSGLSQSPEFNFPGVVSGLVRSGSSGSPHTFAVFLADHPQEASEITLGGWSNRRMEGKHLAWSPVLDPGLGHWLVRIESMDVDGEPVKFCEDGGCRGVVDTGTSLLAVPTPAFPEVYEMLRHPAPLEGECRGRGPSLNIVLAGDNFTLRIGPADYARMERASAPTGPVNFVSGPWPKIQPQGPRQNGTEEKGYTRKDMYCKPLLMSMDLPAPIGPKLFILGEPVLRRFYTVYDARDQKIGFARAHHTPEPSEAGTDDDSDEWWDRED